MRQADDERWPSERAGRRWDRRLGARTRSSTSRIPEGCGSNFEPPTLLSACELLQVLRHGGDLIGREC